MSAACGEWRARVLEGLAPGRPLTIGRSAIRAVLLVAAALATLSAAYDLVRFHPIGVDLEIPLRAVERWTVGDTPYLASSFQVDAGRELPFLYPPFTLPLFALLLEVPRTALTVLWLGAGLVGAAIACRRLGIPPLLLPAVLLWPPFAEALIGGNVQVWLFVAFVYTYWESPTGPMQPRHRDREPEYRHAALGAAVAALKPTQIHPWFEVLRRNPVAGLAGATLVAGLPIIVTLPLVGTSSWVDWFAQLGRASDPAWIAAGIGFNRFLPAPAVWALAVGTVIAAPFVPRRSAGYWIGILLVLGSGSLRIFTVLFLLPAMLRIQPELRLLAAAAISLYGSNLPALWLGIVLVASAFAASSRDSAPNGSPTWPIRRAA